MATLFKTATLTDIDAFSYNNWYKMKVEVYLNSQTNTADKCSSNITIKRFFGTQTKSAGWSSYTTPAVTSSISIDGGSYTNSNSTAIKNLAQNNAGAWVQFGSWTGDITHRTDGTQSINVKLAYSPGSADASYIAKAASVTTGVFDLPALPRQSDLEEIPKFDIDMGFVFNANKPAETSYRKLVVKNGETILREILEEDLVNGYEYLLSDDINTIYSIMSNEFEHTFTFELYTYSDSTMATQLGNASVQTAVGYVTDCTPTFSGFDCVNSRESAVSMTGDNQIYIPNYSDATITISTPAEAYKGATIVGYNINGYGYIPVGEYPLTFTINNINSSFNIQAVDSRGLVSNAVQKNLTWVSGYKIPEIRNFLSARIGGIGTEVKLIFSGVIWEGNFGNGNNQVTKVAYRVQPRGGSYSDWYDITSELGLGEATSFIIDENSGFNLHENGENGGFSAGLSYTVQLALYDGTNGITFNSAIAEVIIQDGYVLDSYYKAERGYRFAINGMVDPEGNVLQVYDDDGNLISGSGDTIPIDSIFEYDGDTVPDGYEQIPSLVDLVYPIGSIYINATDLNPETLFKGTKWERFGKGRTLVGLDEEDDDFKTVELTGGHKAMQEHSHTGTTNSDGAHMHATQGRTSSGSTTPSIFESLAGTGGTRTVNVPRSGTNGAHSHAFTTNKEGTGDSGNLQPYITVYMWKRTE